MNLNKLIFLLLLVVLFPTYIQSQNYSSDAYEFPVKPGMPEWGKLKNAFERNEVCQIPDDVLINISTIGLVETCINYPLIGDIMAANNFVQAFYNLTGFFNGFKELFLRDDAAEKLIQKYLQMSPVNYKRSDKYKEQVMNVFDYLCIELLLSHDSIIDDMSRQEKLKLLKTAVSHYKLKKEQLGYGNLSKFTSCYLIINIGEYFIFNNKYK